MITYTIEYEKDGYTFRSEYRGSHVLPRTGEKIIYDDRIWTVRDIYYRPIEKKPEMMQATVYAHIE